MLITSTLLSLLLAHPVPESHDPPPGTVRIQDRVEGRRLLEAGEYEAAAAIFRSLVADNDKDAFAWLALGRARHGLESFEGALEAHARAAALPPTAGLGAYHAARAAARLERVDDGFTWLGKATAAGWGDRARLAGDAELAALRDDERFARVLPPLLEGDELFVEPTRVLHTLVGEAAGDQFGWVARVVGDLDGDAVLDFAATAPSHMGWAGAVYVHSGRTGALLFRHEGPAGSQLGNSVDGRVDLDGDDVPDVIVGAPGWGKTSGRTRVLSGRTGEMLLELFVGVPGDRFGTKVGAIEDLDGDGVPEILSGAPGDGAGKVHVHSGKGGTLLFTIEGEAPGDQFGVSLDGTREGGHRRMVVGAMKAGAGDRGRAYLYALSAEGAKLVGTIDTDEKGKNLGQYFAAFMGDVNGDGVPDTYVSDWNHGAKGPSTGRLFIHSGADAAPIKTIDGRVAGEGFGTSQSVAGDVDGDGVADLCVGAWQNADAARSAGKIYLVSGRTGEDLATWTSKQAGDTLGFDAVGIGDVDGDGNDDVLVTAAWSTVQHGRQGRVFVLAGPKLRKN